MQQPLYFLTRYGDIHAVNSVEKWYSVLTMLVGIGFFFGPILGYMASTLTNAESKRAQYTHRIAVINDHLVGNKISVLVKVRIVLINATLYMHKKSNENQIKPTKFRYRSLINRLE